MPLIIYLFKSYKEYISKYRTSPNLLFVGEKVFLELVRDPVNLQNLRFSQTLQEHTIYGCLIIRVPSRSYGYNFYEFDDLYIYKDINVPHGRELIIEKLLLEGSLCFVGNPELDPRSTATIDVERLIIPLDVLASFKKQLRRGLKQDDIQHIVEQFSNNSV